MFLTYSYIFINVYNPKSISKSVSLSTCGAYGLFGHIWLAQILIHQSRAEPGWASISSGPGQDRSASPAHLQLPAASIDGTRLDSSSHPGCSVTLGEKYNFLGLMEM